MAPELPFRDKMVGREDRKRPDVFLLKVTTSPSVGSSFLPFPSTGPRIFKYLTDGELQSV